MGFEDLAKKATEAASSALNSEQGEKLVDGALDKAADAAKAVTGGKFDSQIDSAREAADKALGA